ncbi:MAG TPA: hypothetical protein PK170_02230, partial [Anaerolineae bacterium]|nr:hypothetical protein [Anaerolineae bacterium]
EPLAASIVALPAAPPLEPAPLPVVIERTADAAEDDLPREGAFQDEREGYKVAVTATENGENFVISSPRSQYHLRVLQDSAEISYSLDITTRKD